MPARSRAHGRAVALGHAARAHGSPALPRARGSGRGSRPEALAEMRRSARRASRGSRRSLSRRLLVRSGRRPRARRDARLPRARHAQDGRPRDGLVRDRRARRPEAQGPRRRARAHPRHSRRGRRGGSTAGAKTARAGGILRRRRRSFPAGFPSRRASTRRTEAARRNLTVYHRESDEVFAGHACAIWRFDDDPSALNSPTTTYWVAPTSTASS